MSGANAVKVVGSSVLDLVSAKSDADCLGLVVVVHRLGVRVHDYLAKLIDRNPDFVFALCDVDIAIKSLANDSFGTSWEDKVLTDLHELLSKRGMQDQDAVILGLDSAGGESLILGLRGSYKAVIVLGEIVAINSEDISGPHIADSVLRDYLTFHKNRITRILANAGKTNAPFYHFTTDDPLVANLTNDQWSGIARKRELSTVVTSGKKYSDFSRLFAHNLSLITSILGQTLHTYGPHLGIVYNGDDYGPRAERQVLLAAQRTRNDVRSGLVSPALRGDRFYPQGFAIIRGMPASNYGSQTVALSLESSLSRHEYPMGTLIRKHLSDDLYHQTHVDYSVAGFASGRHEGISLQTLEPGKYLLNVSVTNAGQSGVGGLPVARETALASADAGNLYLFEGGPDGSSIQKFSLPGPEYMGPKVHVDKFAFRNNSIHISGSLDSVCTRINEVTIPIFVLTISKEGSKRSFILDGFRHLPAEVLDRYTDVSDWQFSSPPSGLSLDVIQSGEYRAHITVLNGQEFYSVKLNSNLMARTESVDMAGHSAAASRSVGIIGSCVSRDNFNSRLAPDWKDNFTLGPVHYQQSIVSLMSEPVTYDEQNFNSLDAHDRLMTIRDFTKEFRNEFQNSVPEVLIVDLFADARFNCISVDGSIITENEWKLPQAVELYTSMREFRRVGMRIDELEFVELFKQSLYQLKDFLGKNAPRIVIVLNRARAVNEYVLDGRRQHFSQKFNNDLNSIWNKLDEIFINILNPIVIDPMTPGMMSDATHPWGPANVHYEARFYDSFGKKLLDKLGFATVLQIEEM